MHAFSVIPPLKHCIMCLIDTQLREIIDLACTYRRWIHNTIRDNPSPTTYTFECEPTPSWFAFDYTTIPKELNCMSQAITIPIFYNTPMIIPAIHTAMVTTQSTPSVVMHTQDQDRIHYYYSPKFIQADMAVLMHPLSMLSDGSTASIRAILAHRVARIEAEGGPYNAMISTRIISLLSANALLSLTKSDSATAFLRAAADPICQHPTTPFWRASIQAVAIHVAIGAGEFPKLKTHHTTVTQYNGITSQTMCPHFAASIADVLFASSIFSSSDPIDDPSDGPLAVDFSRWSWCSMVDLIADYHMFSKIPIPMSLATNPHRHMTTNVILYFLTVITDSPYSSLTHATPREFPPSYTSKVISIDIGTLEPRVTVSFCPSCNMSSINVFKSVTSVRQRSTISVVLDPMRGAYICDTCYTTCIQLQLTRHIIAPVNISTLIKSYVMNNVGVYPSGLTRASQKYKQTMMAVWRSHKRYIPRINGALNNDSLFVEIQQ
jgi:hypothetical protein